MSGEVPGWIVKIGDRVILLPGGWDTAFSEWFAGRREEPLITGGAPVWPLCKFGADSSAGSFAFREGVNPLEVLGHDAFGKPGSVTQGGETTSFLVVDCRGQEVTVMRVGADASHLFAGEARDSDLHLAAWLGWLPLTLVEFAGSRVALVGDTWLTASAGRSQRPRPAVFGDVLTAEDAADELIAGRPSGLTAFTNRPGDVSSDGPLWPSSVALLVADDLAAHVRWFRTAHARLAGGGLIWIYGG